MVISQLAYVIWRPAKDEKIHWLGYEWSEDGDCYFDSKDFKDAKIFLDKKEAEEEIEWQKRVGALAEHIKSGYEEPEHWWRIKEFKIEF